MFLTRWTNRWSLVGTRSVSFVPRVIKSKGEKTEDCYLVSSCVATTTTTTTKKKKKNRRQNVGKRIETEPKWADRVP